LEAGKYNIGEISSRLRRVRAYTLSLGLVSAIVSALLVLAAAWLLVSLLDMGLGLPWGALRAVALLGGVATAALLAYRLYRTLAASHSIKRYAARIGQELKEIGLDMLTALDLAEVDGEKLGYSNVLITRAIDEITSKVRKLDLKVAVRRRALIIEVVVLVAVLAGGGLWRAGAPGSFAYSVARMKFFLGLTAESGVAIRVMPGDMEIFAGTALQIEAEVEGFLDSDAMLHIVSEEEETRFKMSPAEGDGPAEPGIRTFTSGIARVDKDLNYFVSVSGQRTRTYHISVFEEPRITSGFIRLRPPAYTGLPAQIVPEGVWDIVALYGTRADFALATNASPDSVRFVTWAAGGAREVEYFAVGDDSVTYAKSLLGDFSYSLELVTGDRAALEAHGPHSVKVMEDEPPYVRIESPAKEILLEADMIVPLSVRALDDYGISSMQIHYRSPADSGYADLAYSGRTEARSDHNWDVGDLDVFPGEAVYYYIRVADNDALRGPKFARTETYVARVPTVYDFYEEIEERQEGEVEDLQEVAEEMEELGEAMDDLAEEMKQDREVDWEEEQSMKQTLDRQSELTRDLEDIVSSMDETLDMMSESDLINFEMIEKMEEIRSLLEQVATEEFMQALEKMHEAMEQLAPEDIEQAMKELDLSQEDLMRRLDATIEMLKQLKLEQDMDAVENLARQLLEGEQAVNEEIGEGGDLEEAADKERGLQNDAAGLSEMMKDLAEDLEAAGSPAASEMQDASDFMESSKTGQKMSEKTSAMSEGDRQEAQSMGQDIEGDLEKLNEMVSNAKVTMQGGRQKEVLDALKNVMNGLREVSQRHENIMVRIAEAPPDDEVAELARQEMVYKEAVDYAAEQLFEVSKMSLFVPPELGLMALSVSENMEMAASQLHEGQRGRANNSMKTALKSTNQLIASIAEATDKASSCSSSSSMCDAMSSLQNMSCQQMGINMGTQELFDESGQLTMDARAQMSRLAAQQESVRQGLEEMMREYGNRGEILGRMDDLIEEAERIIEALRNQRVDEDTLRRQEKILTRLLNAQKSLRRRDYSQRRKSEPGEEYAVKPPPELTLEERERLIEDILYRRRGYYPPEYEELIRAYIRAIAEHE
jgi:DNA-binding transcriptional regulator YiaG